MEQKKNRNWRELDGNKNQVNNNYFSLFFAWFSIIFFFCRHSSRIGNAWFWVKHRLIQQCLCLSSCLQSSIIHLSQRKSGAHDENGKKYQIMTRSESKEGWEIIMKKYWGSNKRLNEFLSIHLIRSVCSATIYYLIPFVGQTLHRYKIFFFDFFLGFIQMLFLN